MWLGQPSKPGSLLKPDYKPKREKIKTSGPGQRKPREKIAGHLAAIRQCQCLSCGQDPCGEAAHLRISTAGKPNAGIGAKPDDKWTNPLCHDCHLNKQHQEGERAFWKRLGIDPFKSAVELFTRSPNIEAMREYVLKLRSNPTPKD